MKIRYDRPQVWWNEKLNRLRVFIPNPDKTHWLKCFSDWADYGGPDYFEHGAWRCCYHDCDSFTMRRLAKEMKDYDDREGNGEAIFLGNL